MGGRKPLLVMETYWRPVIDCLRQEPTLVSPTADLHAAAMDLITPVSNAD